MQESENRQKNFIESYARLNAGQKEAVDTIEGPVMVIAGPGTGKTTILTLRIANILRQTDTPPSGILAITYTDSGVKAMRKKLRESLGGRADEVRIHTFHGFAVSVIKEYPDHFPHLSDTEPLPEIDARAYIREILEAPEFSDMRPLGKPELYIDPILHAISDCKKEAHTPEMIRESAMREMKAVSTDDSMISTRGASKGELKADAKKIIQKCERTILFADVYERYEARKRAEEKIDFDDMIFELQHALKRDELLRRMVQEQFLYLLVDEHQDTNDSQNMLIMLIAEFFDTPNVFIVGDEKQAIYRFQGASVENFLKFKRVWQGVKVIQLSSNYRSHQKILDAAFRLIEHNYADGEYVELRTPLTAESVTDKRPITLASAATIGDSEIYLVSKLKEIEANSPKSEVAIIVRTNAAVERVQRLCEQHGIKASSVRSADIFEHPVGRVYFDLLSAIRDPLDVVALGKTVAAGLWKLPFEERVEVLQEIKRGEVRKSSSIQKRLSSLRDSIFSNDPIGFLFEVAEVSGFSEMIARESERIEIWRGIVHFAGGLCAGKTEMGTDRLLDTLVAYRDMSEEKRVKIQSGDPNAMIKIMTAHGSKGLEFDQVFLPYATESFWMKKAHTSFFVLPFVKRDPEEDSKDTRRLFFVALTRAKRHAEIIVHATREGGEPDLPFRLLQELGAENLEEVSIPSMPDFASAPRRLKHDRIKTGFIEAAKRVLVDSGLSVTALNHFLTCPNMFLFRSVLRIPDQPSAASEKGNAMHAAFARVWKSGEKDTQAIEALMLGSALQYLDRSLLGKVERDAVRKQLEKEIPIVASALHGHFALEGQVRSETDVSGTVEVVAGGSKISVPIHGRLDLVIESEDSVLVFDYKTKKSMSVAEIKGETKNSDGGYLRQLAFYTLLLSQDPRYAKKEIKASLVFATPDEKGRVAVVGLPITDAEITVLTSAIQKLAESVYSGAIADATCEDPNCEWCKLKAVDF